uniref:ATP synthase F0 subunit 6 n=1 Tax=Xestocephalus gracilus TaxID=3112137 RepID=UPI002E79A8B0|nr:ATP synthase F0 subunit 6 [Xestocephalus gracilus]WRK21301.1 ATP synthase F0 subunit 6 [Xestocephalus gracilus]
MMNLFSTFDPCTGLMSMNWLSMLMFTLMLPYKFWTTNNTIQMLIKKTNTKLHNEMKSLMPYKGSTMLFLMLFNLILMNNMMGLMPYIFTSTSHLATSMSMALPMWTAMMLYGWTKKTNKMMEHLVPIGTPNMLMPFMIIIETTSNIIRPISLMVRLTANMIAGHLLMSLLGNNTTPMLMMTTMMIFMALMTFEMAVAMIQSYVFMTLMTLYSSEI